MRVHFLPSQKDYKSELETAAKQKRQARWTCPKKASVGDPVFLLILGEGIVATGFVKSAPRREPKASIFKTRYWAWIDRIRLLRQVIPLSAVIRRFPTWGYPTYPRTYTTIESPFADEVVVFIAHDHDLRPNGSGDAALFFEEGHKSMALVTKYERSRQARNICLAKWGHQCAACGVDLGET